MVPQDCHSKQANGNPVEKCVPHFQTNPLCMYIIYTYTGSCKCIILYTRPSHGACNPSVRGVLTSCDMPEGPVCSRAPKVVDILWYANKWMTYEPEKKKHINVNPRQISHWGLDDIHQIPESLVSDHLSLPLSVSSRFFPFLPVSSRFLAPDPSRDQAAKILLQAVKSKPHRLKGRWRSDEPKIHWFIIMFSIIR